MKSSLTLILVHVLKAFHLKTPLLMFLPPFPYHSNYNLTINIQKVRMSYLIGSTFQLLSKLNINSDSDFVLMVHSKL